MEKENIREEVIEVKKSQLDSILAKQASQDEELGILREAVSQNRLFEVQRKHSKPENKRGYLKIHDGNLVIGWQSNPKNKLVYGPTGMIAGEILQTKLFYLDGKDSGWIDQVEFTRINIFAYFRIIEENKDGYLIKMEDAKWGDEPFTISPTFVNP